MVFFYLPFWKGKDGKDGQNSEIFKNFILHFYRISFILVFLNPESRIAICFLTEKDGRDGKNGDVVNF